MWNRAPQWPGSAARGDFLGNARAVPSDPALGRPDTSDPYSSGQFLPALAPVPTAPDQDQIRTDAYVAPYTGPLDLDDYGRETDEMRRAYDDLHRKEPAVRSAIDGKAASVAALDLIVKPRDKTKPADVAAAAFVKEQLEQSEHGPDGLILNMLRAAFIRGWAVLEKTFRAVPGPTGPRWGLLHCKSRDTAHLRLRLDGYRNVLGVVNTVRGIRTHDPRKVILFTHADLYSNPYGQSDLRAAYRSASLINDAYQLWHVAVKVFGGPFLKGTVADAARRKQMETALKAARAAGYIVSPEGDDVEILNMASATSFDAFEKKVRIHREEIYLAVRHAYMPFMQSSSGGADQRGDTGVNKSAGSDPLEFLIAKAVGRVLSHQLAPDLVTPNFPAGTGMPIVQLGGTSWGETKAQLDVAAMLQDKWKLPVSAEYLYDVTQMPPPKGPGDTPPGASGGAGGAGGGPGAPAAPAPSAPANPAAPNSTAPGGPAPAPVGAGTAPAAAPAVPAAPASAFSADQAPKYASYFAPSRHGHYPGDLHEQFGLGVAQFAGATGLLRRQVRRAGATGWVWAPPAVPPQPPPAPPPEPVEFALGAAVPVPVALLGTDPARLQWRPGANPADGTARPLPAERYDPAKGGTLLGWRDPVSGRALVVEGHHRLAHARRDGAASVPVRFVDAPDAEAAREIGRRANERGAAFASEHADGEEWESNGRRYKRVGGETVRLPSATEQGGGTAPAAPAAQGGGTAPAAPAAQQPAAPPSPPAPPAPDVPPEVRAAGESIAQELAGDPEAVKPGVFGRLKGLALDAAIKVYSVAARIQDSRAAGLVATALDAYFDSPKDLEKLGYNPTNSSGGVGPQVLDPVKNATEDALGIGLSGHLAAKVAAVALTKALFWLKGKLGGSQMAALDPTGELAAALADLYDAANAAVGLGPVDRAAVGAALARLSIPTGKRFALDVLGDAPEAVTEEEFLRLIESGEWLERAAGEGEAFAQCGPGLAPKKVTVQMKSGKSYERTVCAKTDEAKKEAWAKGEAARADAAKAKKDAADAAKRERVGTATESLKNPEAADPLAFADAVARLTVSELQALKRDLGVKGGKLKGELQQKLVERFKERLAEVRAKGAPPAPELPAVVPPTAPPVLPANVTVRADTAATSARVNRLLGEDTAPELLAAAANAGPGATVTAMESRIAPGAVLVTTSGDGYYASRQLYRKAGQLVAYNSSFRIKQKPNPDYDPAAPPGDVRAERWVQENPAVNGTELLANQVRALRALGAAKIRTHAARYDVDDPNYAMNGYYTWPRLGYDAAIPRDKYAQLPPELKAQVDANPTGSAKRRSILGLMTTKAGRDWWKANGDSLDMEFDLKNGSLSMRTLEAYLTERAAKKG